jgi:hypothetical protein
MTLVKRPSIEKLRELFEYDPETGILKWADGRRSGQIAGYTKPHGRTFYRIIEIEGVNYRAHIIAFALHRGRWPDLDIVHKNRNCLDNRADNLREASHTENMQNARRNSEFKGVYTRDKNPAARIHILGKNVHLGAFKSKRDATLAYNRAAILAFGEFARTNFLAHESEHVILSERVLKRLSIQ